MTFQKRQLELALEFKSNNSIKSRLLKRIVKYVLPSVQTSKLIV